MNNTPVTHNTPITQSEAKFIKEVVKPGDNMYVLLSSVGKTETVHYTRVTIEKLYPHVVKTSKGFCSWTDVIMGYRYETGGRIHYD